MYGIGRLPADVDQADEDQARLRIAEREQAEMRREAQETGTFPCRRCRHVYPVSHQERLNGLALCGDCFMIEIDREDED